MKTPHDLSLARRAKFLKRFDLSSRHGLEIGPFDKPVFPRSSYPNVLYADVKDTVELRQLAAANPLRDPAAVVPVDYVLMGKRLDEVVPAESLDFIFCAHVLEHVPDMISMLQSAERVLRPGGLFLIVFPDRRYTFDIDRRATTLDQLTDRHARFIMRPDPDTVEDYYLHFRPVHTGRIWARLEGAKEPLRFTPHEAQKKAELARSTYVDVHCNVLSSDEFAPMISALNTAKLTALSVHVVQPTVTPLNEFCVALVKPLKTAPSFGQRVVRKLTGRCGSNPLIR